MICVVYCCFENGSCSVGVFLLFEMVTAQLYDMCGVLLLDTGVFCSMRW